MRTSALSHSCLAKNEITRDNYLKVHGRTIQNLNLSLWSASQHQHDMLRMSRHSLLTEHALQNCDPTLDRQTVSRDQAHLLQEMSTRA